MASNRSRLPFMGTLALLGGLTLGLGSFIGGCGPSGPPAPTPPQDTPAPVSTPVAPLPMAQESQEPTAADVAAARPKKVFDPFTLPSMKGPGAMASAEALAKAHDRKTHDLTKNHSSKVAATTVKVLKAPPTPPNLQAVGIFGGTHGPVAILAPNTKTGTGPAAGTIIVETGTKLDDGGYVKSIDPASRKVVIDKENTDFVLPLEAPAGVPGSGPSSPSATGK